MRKFLKHKVLTRLKKIPPLDWALIIVVSIVFFGSLFILNHYRGDIDAQWDSLFTKNQKQQFVQLKPDKTASPVDTSSWQTYLNSVAGYSIKYPANFYLNAFASALNPNYSNAYKVDFGKYKLPANFVGDNELKKAGYYIEIWVEKNKTLEDVLKENDKNNFRAGYRSEKTIFSGLDAYKIYNTGLDFPRDILIVAKNGKVYSVNINYLVLPDTERSEADRIYQGMLSTFKLVN